MAGVAESNAEGELVRLGHVLGILGSFVFQSTLVISVCVAATLPLLLHSALMGRVRATQVVAAIIFVGCAVFIAVKADPFGLGRATMLVALALIALQPESRAGRRTKIATWALLFLVFYVFGGLVFLGSSVDTVLMHSKNYLSVLGLVFYVAAMAEWHASEERPPAWLEIPAIVLCLLSVSLAGLICASALLVYSLVRSIGLAPVVIAAVIVGHLIAIATVFLLPEDGIGDLLSLIPRDGSPWAVLFAGLADRVAAFANGEAGGDRLQIWNGYLRDLDAFSWLVGLPRDELMGSSLHNSLLDLHMHYGLLAGGMLAAWAIMFFRARLSVGALFVLSVLAFRSMADSVLLGGSYFDGLFLLSLRMYEPSEMVTATRPADTSGRAAGGDIGSRPDFE